MAHFSEQICLDIKDSNGKVLENFSLPENQALPILKTFIFEITYPSRCACKRNFEGCLTYITTDPSVVAEFEIFQINKFGNRKDPQIHKQKVMEGVKFKFQAVHTDLNIPNNRGKFEILMKIWQKNRTVNPVYFKYFNNDDLSNFSVECSDGVKIPAHTFVLAANSPVFKAMLEVPMRESEKDSVTIEDIDSDTMLELLRFMYCGEVENIDKIAKELAHAAEKYDVENLKEFCGAAMIKDVSDDTILEYCSLAFRYRIDCLLVSCWKFIKDNIKKFCGNEMVENQKAAALKLFLDACNCKH